MALLTNSKTLVLDENGVLHFTEAGDYSLAERAKYIQVLLDGGQTTNVTEEQLASLGALDIGAGANVTIAADDILAGKEIAGLEGTLDITGVSFTEAGPTDGGPDQTVEPSTGTGLDTLIGSAIESFGAGYVVNHLTVNGSQTDAFELVWDYLDDGYVLNPYNIDLNENFVRLGIEYVHYLEAGGDPLTFVTAKFMSDDGDTNTTPEREESMHDNLLGNLTIGAIQDRFGVGTELTNELLSLIPDEYEARPGYYGYEAQFGGAKHDGVRAFDYAHGWDRPDYIETTISGTVDERAQDAGTEMLYGNGNTVDGWNIVRHEGAGVELALKAKERGGSDYAATVGTDGLTHYAVDSGLDAGTTDRAAWNFDFAATSAINDYTSDLVDHFDFKLLLDVDRTEATQFLELDPTAISDNPASDYSAQNSENYAFGFIYDFIDGDPGTDGIQAYDFGQAQFDVVLEAYDAGELIATNHIVVDVLDLA